MNAAAIPLPMPLLLPVIVTFAIVPCCTPVRVGRALAAQASLDVAEVLGANARPLELEPGGETVRLGRDLAG